VNGVRLMVFYDGGYFRQGQVYFRYKDNRGWFSLPELHGLFEKYVASKTKSPMETTKLVAAHFYEGRASTRAIETDQLEKERDFEMALISAGIVPHYLAASETLKPGSPTDTPEFWLAEKGVDVKYALDVLDYAHTDRFDVAVLVTGDGDFVPLVRKITSLGKQALIAHFDFDAWVDSRGSSHRPNRASKGLIDAASWSLNFNHIVKDQDWKTEVKALFFMPKVRAETKPYPDAAPAAADSQRRS